MTDAGNRSGGADFHANEVEVGGDVVGRDKVVQPTTYNYYGALPAQPRRAELPHQPYFFGREDELAIIAEALDPESNGWGVLIDGPGGIGKTALAIRAGHLVSGKIYPTKIFLSAKVRELTPEREQKLEDFMLPNYMALLAELARELGDEGIERIDPNERPKEVRRLLENSHALIIIDNLETFDEQGRERLFQFLKRLPRSCKAIVTSRRRTDVAAEIIRLNRLSAEATQKLIAKLAERNNYLARANQEDCQKLYEITQGNPLLIEWIAGQLGRLGSKCRTIAEACQYLESAPRANDPFEYIFGDLLNTFREHELAVLAALFHFRLPARAKHIAGVAGIAESATVTTLEDLFDRSLVVSDREEHQCLLPSLVASFLRRERWDLITQTSRRLLDHAYLLASENGYDKYERFPILEAEWQILDGALPLILKSENTSLQQFCAALNEFLDLSGRWDERLALNLQAEERAVVVGDAVNAGWRAFYAGRTYYFRGEADKVMACADRAEAHWVYSGACEKAYALRLRGLAYQLNGDYYEAMRVFRQALELWLSIAPESNDSARGWNNLAEAQKLSGDLVSAEKNFREALRIAQKVGFRKGVPAYMGRLAVVAIDQGDWPAAQLLAKDALRLAEEMQWQAMIAESCYRIAVALVQQGQRLLGLSYAKRAVEIYTKLHHGNLKKAQAIFKECSD
jgi:tetratricopeptide (TPR) repeat protein